MGGRGAFRSIGMSKGVANSKKEVHKRESASDKIKKVIRDLRSPKGYSSQRPFAIGLVEKRMEKFASDNNIELSSKSVYMSTKSITQAIRKSKGEKSLAVSGKDLIDFPSKRRSMDLFFDGKSFIYTDYKTKYIIHPNYKMKIDRNKISKVNFVTAGRVADPKEFKLKKYIKVI